MQTGEFPIEVLVETVTSRENVRRAAQKLGCTVQVKEKCSCDLTAVALSDILQK
jgi:hypothetical protein